MREAKLYIEAAMCLLHIVAIGLDEALNRNEDEQVRDFMLPLVVVCREALA